MIAHLPMYDVPANTDAHGRLWDIFFAEVGISGAGPTLHSNDLFQDWLSPNLLLSQTCGLPFRAKLRDKVQYVATPDYRLAGCPAGYYRSAIVSKRGTKVDLSTNDFNLAINDPLSQSGWAAPWAEGIKGRCRIVTGAHAASARAVLDGQADVAAIDALTLYFLQRDQVEMTDLHVLHWTTPTPVLPYITALGQDVSKVRTALENAIHTLPVSDRKALQLYGVVDIPESTYCALSIPPDPQSAV